MADTVSVTSSAHSSYSRRSGMSDEEQKDRRKMIKDIMSDPTLSQADKSKAIQTLMDGRRRSSIDTTSRSLASHEGGAAAVPTAYVSAMSQAAATAVDYFSSDEEGDALMFETAHGSTPDDISYVYDNLDDRSVSSEITHTSHELWGSAALGLGLSSTAVAATVAAPVPPGAYRQVHGRSFSLQEWNDGDKAQVVANSSIFASNIAQISRLMEQSRSACEHYERNCTIISACCGLAFGCRICHDECPVLPPPLSEQKERALLAHSTNHHPKITERRRSLPTGVGGGFSPEEYEDNHHPIDRFAIREVICRECYTRQSSKTNNCIVCGVRFGAYHCIICNLWMSNDESPYHCEDCGFCRVGGRDNFTHCHDCGMCIDAQLFHDHNCKSGKYMSNCPICQDDLFSSRHASHEMPCGHAIHWHCFKELTSYDTRCPVCKKTAETPDQMQATWSAIAMGIALQPVPPDMARAVSIYCNDCEERDTNRRWHFLGVRCNHCMSFNTNVEQILLHGRDAVNLLDELDATQRASGVPTDIMAMDEDAPGAQDTSSGSQSEANFMNVMF